MESPEALLEQVAQIDDPDQLKQLLQARFLQEATLVNPDPHAPFIAWEDMNRDPKGYVAEAVSKIAFASFPDAQVVLTIPRSATWMRGPLQRHFPEADFPHILKSDQRATHPHIQFAPPVNISSYTRNRGPDNSRGTEEVFIEQGDYQGKDFLIVDDVAAQGQSAEGLAAVAQEQLGARRVNVTITMAKLMQGGIDALIESPYIDHVEVAIPVRAIQNGHIVLD